MHTKEPKRRRAALVALAALAALTLPAAADDDRAVTRSSADGYPRSANLPPVALAGDTDGHGEPCPPGGRTYDTNWILPGSWGDSNLVWFRVNGASIQGFGHASDADTDSASCYSGRAWGEERLEFSVALEPGERGSIVVENQLGVVASWAVDGTGVNHAILDAELLDVNDEVHRFRRHRKVDPAYSGRSGEREEDTTTSGDSDNAGLGKDGLSGGIASSGSDTETTSEESETEFTSAESDVNGDDEGWTARRAFPAPSCSVKVASAMLLQVQAHTVVEDRETNTRVPRFDCVQIVSASYVVDGPAPSEPPCGTPGGDEGRGAPTTPGGGGGTGPTTPSGGEGTGGAAPGGTTPGSTAPDGTTPAPAEPATPAEPRKPDATDEPWEPFGPLWPFGPFWPFSPSDDDAPTSPIGGTSPGTGTDAAGGTAPGATSGGESGAGGSPGTATGTSTGASTGTSASGGTGLPVPGATGGTSPLGGTPTVPGGGLLPSGTGTGVPEGGSQTSGDGSSPLGGTQGGGLPPVPGTTQQFDGGGGLAPATDGSTLR